MFSKPFITKVAMHLFQRAAALFAALFLSSAMLASLPVAPALAATAPSPGTVPIEEVEGTPHAAHASETAVAPLPKGRELGTEALELQGAAGLSRTGDIKVALVTVQLADKSAAETSAISLDAAKNGITASSNYWKAMSNNRLSMSVASVRTGFKSSATSGQDYYTITNTVTRELGWVSSPYTALVIYVPVPTLSWGALGFGASSDGTSGRILMPLPSKFTNNVVAHEFGHVLGLMHADSLQCGSGIADVGPSLTGGFADTSCSIREYGDTTDLMGAAQYSLPAISSSFWDRGGFGRGDEIFNAGLASGVKKYTLKAWAGSEANRAVKFTDPKSKEVYYLELRLPVGYDAATAVSGNRGVKIVQSGGATSASSLILMPSTLPFSGYYASNQTWQAGQTFTTYTGTRVTVDYVTSTSAGITINASPFIDAYQSAFQTQIDWMYYSQLSTGWADGTYRPFATMSREAMAAFMYRLAGNPEFTPPAVSPFIDVPTSHDFYRPIAWMNRTELSTGWADHTYRPYESITREAMSAFLNRYAAKLCRIADANIAGPAVSPFVDMTPASGFYREISWMKHAEISTGWADGTYRPADAVTREQMAAFIYRLDGYVAANGGCVA
ncbi:S-layer homology domain-containing protein [Arthrobacter oryzae]|uniref:S-layer homology domain-containing protein n=1 Tax=Arthrobacter oryzae TaxID=409290 RepID=UPI002862F0C2|nr:S-layer homology domain-containing protein [Arthrobacter oryzae]MDR6508742.1 hypothetical protein [Arthrobacter oryzae]